jgi:hypothetical protein
MTKILEAVHRCLEKFVSLVHDFAAVITGLFILICFLQVTLPYVFNSPIYGADEIVVALMIWSMALGFTVLYWNNEHAVIEFLLRKLPRFFYSYCLQHYKYRHIDMQLYIFFWRDNFVPAAGNNKTKNGFALSQGVLLCIADGCHGCLDVTLVRLPYS